MVLSTNRKSQLAYSIKTDRHELTADVSEKLGGEDLGPDPHALLEASLASCTSITAQMYANRKGLDLKSCVVTIKILEEGEKNRIALHAEFEGRLSDADRARLAEIIEKCPIHKFLLRGAEIETTTA